MSPRVLQRPDIYVLGVCETPRKGMQTHALHEVPLLRGVEDNFIFATKPQNPQEWECTPVWECSSVMRLSVENKLQCAKCRVVSH